MSNVIYEFIPAVSFWGSAKVKVNVPTMIQGVVIPSGFISDGASIPRWLPFVGLVCWLLADWLSVWFYIPGLIFLLALALFSRFGLSFNAALLHDYELKSNIDQWWSSGLRFFKQLRHDGIWWWVACIAFVLMTGWQCVFAIKRWLVSFRRCGTQS